MGALGETKDVHVVVNPVFPCTVVGICEHLHALFTVSAYVNSVNHACSVHTVGMVDKCMQVYSRCACRGHCAQVLAVLACAQCAQ